MNIEVLPRFIQWGEDHVSDHFTFVKLCMSMKFSGGSDGKESCCNAGEPSSILLGSRKIPWRRAWKPTPVFLPGESHE